MEEFLFAFIAKAFFFASVFNKYPNNENDMRKKDCLTMLVFALCLCSCNKATEVPQKAEPVKVKVLKVGAASQQETWRFSGTVTEENGGALSFPFMAQIEQIYVGMGSKVKKGQLIARANSTAMKSAHEAAVASLRQAEDAWKRMKELYDKGSLAEIKWVEIQSKLAQARSMEAMARKNLNDCKLYAPYSGVIAEKVAEVGQNVAPGAPVVRLVTGNSLAIKISVPETDISKVYEGQAAQIIIPALGQARLTGNVCEKGVLANPMSRSYEVKIKLSGAQGNVLPGMVAEVYLPTEGATQNYVIPARVLQIDEQNRTFVWLNQKGKATKREIRCGEFTSSGVTVLSGLKDGDEIITEGQQKVCENTPLSF